MKSGISVHNSAQELEITPEIIEQYGFEALSFDGMPYRQLVCNADRPGRFSLVMFLHGVGSVGVDNFAQLRGTGRPMADFCIARGEKAVLIFPQCPAGSQWVDVPWDALSHSMPELPSEYMNKVLRLLDAKLQEFEVNQDRVYAGGISMGGYGAWDLVSRRPELFAAVLPICGGGDSAQAEALRHVAVYTLHGDQDSAVPVSRSRDMVRALLDAGNYRVVYRELPGIGHNAWDTAWADERALAWLFAQRRKKLAEDFRIRQATDADFEFIVRQLDMLLAMEQDFEPDPEKQYRGVSLLLHGPLSTIFVAEAADGTLAASCSVQLLVSTAEGAYSAMIEDIVVEEHFRKCGLGARLLEAAASWAAGRGATRMQLVCDDVNFAAKEFYQRTGWERTHLESYFRYLR